MILRIVGKLGPRWTALALGVLLAAIALALAWVSLVWNPPQ